MGTDTLALDPQLVIDIFTDCLYHDGEDTSGHIVAEGITFTAGLHPERVYGHMVEIHALLGELPDEFKTSGGGGMSFLNACMDKNGNQWTGEHRTQELLIMLGIAIGDVEYCMPREMWSMFPGGMPYFMILQ